MLFLSLFLMLTTVAALVAVRYRMEVRTVAGRAPQQAPTSEAPATLEGALVAQRIAGDITEHQYARAMQRIAARDADRHPLAVPPDAGPARN